MTRKSKREVERALDVLGASPPGDYPTASLAQLLSADVVEDAPDVPGCWRLDGQVMVVPESVAQQYVCDGARLVFQDETGNSR